MLAGQIQQLGTVAAAATCSSSNIIIIAIIIIIIHIALDVFHGVSVCVSLGFPSLFSGVNARYLDASSAQKLF